MVNRNPLKRPGRRPADCADGRCHGQLGGGKVLAAHPNLCLPGTGEKGARRPRSRISSAANPCTASGKGGKRVCVREVSDIRDSGSWLRQRAPD
jgi:hypothetical protein